MAERIPLPSDDRFSLVVRLGGIECRLRVYWQPGSTGWYGDLEAPVGSPIASGRRLGLNTSLLAGSISPIAGDIFVRNLGVTPPGEPGRNPWGGTTATHALIYEPA